MKEYPLVISTVDVAILEQRHGVVGVWLGRKSHQSLHRFIGGFCQPDCRSDEEDAAREVLEETGLVVDKFSYIGNCFIDDARYAEGVDKIRTRFFVATVASGTARAADDIEAVKWFSLMLLSPDDVVEEHRPLMEMLREWVHSVEGALYLRSAKYRL